VDSILHHDGTLARVKKAARRLSAAVTADFMSRSGGSTSMPDDGVHRRLQHAADLIGEDHSDRYVEACLDAGADPWERTGVNSLVDELKEQLRTLDGGVPGTDYSGAAAYARMRNQRSAGHQADLQAKRRRAQERRRRYGNPLQPSAARLRGPAAEQVDKLRPR